MNENEKAAIVYIPGNKLFPHPDNPRKDLGDLDELTESIKAKGILQNLTIIQGHRVTSEEWSELAREYHDNPSEELRNKMNSIHSGEFVDDGYTIVIGHRRWAAGTKAGLTEFPCVISQMTEAEQIQTMLLENMQRSDLSIVEQAFGFQMMLDLGDSVADISEKTGFSESTVRRRVKLLELDHEKLKSIESAQFSLDDLDKLNKIESIETRNELLTDLGTNNFNFKYTNALNKQKRDKLNKEAVEYLESMGIKEYFGKDYTIKKSLDVGSLKSESMEKFFDECSTNHIELFYVMNPYFLYLVSKPNPTDPNIMSERERERQRSVCLANHKREIMHRTNQNMYSLRFTFIKQFTKTNAKKYFKEIARYFAKVVAKDYYEVSGDSLRELMGITGSEAEDDIELAHAVDSAVDYSPELLMLHCIYSTFGDSERLGYFNMYSPDEYYSLNEELDNIYEFLTNIGYELSDGEMQLRDGSSPMFDRDNMIYKLEDEPNKAVPLDKFLTDVRTYNTFKRCGVVDSEDLTKKEQEGKLSEISDTVYARAVKMAQEHGVELPRRNPNNEGEGR